MVKEQATKIAKKRKLSKRNEQSASQNDSSIALFKAVPSKSRHLGNYKEFFRRLLSNEADFEPAD